MVKVKKTLWLFQRQFRQRKKRVSEEVAIHLDPRIVCPFLTFYGGIFSMVYVEMAAGEENIREWITSGVNEDYYKIPNNVNTTSRACRRSEDSRSVLDDFGKQFGCATTNSRKTSTRHFDTAKRCLTRRIRELEKHNISNSNKLEQRIKHLYPIKTAYVLGRNCLKQQHVSKNDLKTFKDSVNGLLDDVGKTQNNILTAKYGFGKPSNINSRISEPELKKIFDRAYPATGGGSAAAGLTGNKPRTGGGSAAAGQVIGATFIRPPPVPRPGGGSAAAGGHNHTMKKEPLGSAASASTAPSPTPINKHSNTRKRPSPTWDEKLEIIAYNESLKNKAKKIILNAEEKGERVQVAMNAEKVVQNSIKNFAEKSATRNARVDAAKETAATANTTKRKTAAKQLKRATKAVEEAMTTTTKAAEDWVKKAEAAVEAADAAAIVAEAKKKTAVDAYNDAVKNKKRPKILARFEASMRTATAASEEANKNANMARQVLENAKRAFPPPLLLENGTLLY